MPTGGCVSIERIIVASIQVLRGHFMSPFEESSNVLEWVCGTIGRLWSAETGFIEQIA